MAIFARLALMIFAILFSAGFSGAAVANGFGARSEEAFFGVGVGAIVGIFIGRALGNMVVGKPPKD